MLEAISPSRSTLCFCLEMAELYRTWQSSHECLVHYVSAMPSQLYHATQKFLDREQFPSGSFRTLVSLTSRTEHSRCSPLDMRHLKLVDSDKVQLITKVMDFIQRQASQTHKLKMIENIVTRAPSNQRFFLVGDSGELDPEVNETQPINLPQRNRSSVGLRYHF